MEATTHDTQYSTADSAAASVPAASRWRGGAHRASTLVGRRAMVERVVAELRRRFAEPLTLEDMARVAICSPFHFNRIFRQVTGLPPCRFLAALRLAAAKRLLVTTRLSVTEICYAVGCGSLGTFTTCFTHCVGVPPRAFRRAASAGNAALIASALREASGRAPTPRGSDQDGRGGSISGRVVLADGSAGPVAVGLFRAPVPRGRPMACCLVRGGCEFHMTDVPDGRYHLFALALGTSTDPATLLLDEYAPRGAGGPVGPCVGSPQRADVVLRPPRLTDPPILIAVPMLLAERVGGTCTA